MLGLLGLEEEEKTEESLLVGAAKADLKRMEGANATRIHTRSSKEEVFEEWFWLFHTNLTFQSQDPEKHSMHAVAMEAIDPNQDDYQYYQGTFDALVVLCPRFLRIMNGKEMYTEPVSPPIPHRSKLYHESFQMTARKMKALALYLKERENGIDTFTDLIKLQTGISCSHLLRCWPPSWIPSLPNLQKKSRK